MEVYSSEGLSGSPELKNLAGLLEDWKRQGPRKGLEFADFEQQVRLAVMALERRTIREGLQALDVAVDEIKVADEVLCRAYGKPFEAAYVCLAGEIRVSRHLYRRADGMGKALCPLELRAGIVESSWTPQAAERICQTVAVMTPYEAEVVIAGFGGMKPSRSSLDRIPEQVSARWEARREEFERGVRQQETVPQEVETVAVSLDGVMAPLREEEVSLATRKRPLKVTHQGQLLTPDFTPSIPEPRRRLKSASRTPSMIPFLGPSKGAWASGNCRPRSRRDVRCGGGGLPSRIPRAGSGRPTPTQGSPGCSSAGSSPARNARRPGRGSLRPQAGGEA